MATNRNYSALIALLPALIQFADDIHGPKSGKKKLSTVTTLAQNAILVAGAAGIIDPDMATNTVAITDAIENTLVAMKARQIATTGVAGRNSIK